MKYLYSKYCQIEKVSYICINATNKNTYNQLKDV